MRSFLFPFLLPKQPIKEGILIVGLLTVSGGEWMAIIIVGSMAASRKTCMHGTGPGTKSLYPMHKWKTEAEMQMGDGGELQ